jgi:hypothetical protein
MDVEKGRQSRQARQGMEGGEAGKTGEACKTSRRGGAAVGTAGAVAVIVAVIAIAVDPKFAVAGVWSLLLPPKLLLSGSCHDSLLRGDSCDKSHPLQLTVLLMPPQTLAAGCWLLAAGCCWNCWLLNNFFVDCSVLDSVAERCIYSIGTSQLAGPPR